MVGRIGQFINNYLTPLKQKDLKQEAVKDNAIQNAFFDKIDKNNNSVLEENEIALIDNAKELNPENEQDKQMMEMAAQVAQIAPEDTESVLAIDGTPHEIVVVSKKDENGVQHIKTMVHGDDKHPLILTEDRELKDGAETITKFNEDGSKSVQKGAVTTNFDASGRITSVVTDKGNGMSESVEYEYEGDSNVPTKQTNVAMDGTRTEVTENITNPNEEVAVEGEEPVEGEDPVEEATEPPAAEESDPPTSEGTVDRNGGVFAKEGETFLKTAQRIFGDPNLTKDDPRYKALAEANPKDAQRNWFKLGAEIKIPEDMKASLADEAFGVDNEAEAKQYVDKAVDKANIDKYNDDNTESVTLDKDQTWWALAKQNLQDTGVEKPTYAQIYERIGELIKMNPGKEPTAGTEIKVPKAEGASESAPTEPTAPTEAEEPAEELTPISTPPEATDANPPEKTSTPPEQDTNPPAARSADDMTKLNEKAPDKAGQEVRNEDGTVSVYNDEGFISQIKDANGNTTFNIIRTESGEVDHAIAIEYDGDKEAKNTYYDKDGNVTQYCNFEYDEDGNVTKEVARDAEGNVTSITENKYKNGKLSVSIERKADGSLDSYNKYEYYENGEEKRVSNYDADGNLIGYTEIDEEGNRVTYNPDGTVKVAEEEAEEET